jgi:hypothetical protein
MLTRMLERLHLFVGWKRDNNDESMLFKFINDWILIQSGGSWDNPDAVSYLLENTNHRELVVNYIDQVLQSRHAISYLGLRQFLKYRGFQNLPFSWGWKDPRNTFTLPLWLDLFPGARIIHVYRHGVDVATSLKRRYEKAFLAEKRSQEELPAYAYWFRRKRRLGFTSTLRCATLEGGFSLWQSYIEQAHNYALVYSDRAIEVKYEDFLQNPVQELQKLASFCDLDVMEDDIHSAASLANPDRVYVYRNDPVSTKFAVTVRDKLASWDYYD